VAGVGTF